LAQVFWLKVRTASRVRAMTLMGSRAIRLLLAPVAACAFGKWALGNPEMMWYRVTTSLRALMAIYTLPEDHVKDFLASYELFDHERVLGKSDSEHTVNYYKVLNHLCAVGEVEKMYIPPVMDPSLGVFENQILWEEKGMADKLDLAPGASVLDLGCGRGRIAHHVASYSRAHVTGLNIDGSQIRTAQEYANSTGFQSQLTFVQANFNDPLPFADETFDALYQVQVLTYTADPVKLFQEMYRVLKPGARISFLDWVQLPAFNATDARHLDLLRKVKALIGAVWTPKVSDFLEPLEQVGFRILSSQEASITGGQSLLIDKADVYFVSVQSLLTFLAKVHLVPQHFVTLFERLTRDGQAFVESDKLGLFTTSWQIIAQKPGPSSFTA